jgi:4-hydroxy-2-oxoheptanedioate aldolase
MKMRESRVLKKLRAGEVVSCFKVNFGDGQASELVALTGFDCIWIDREHQGQDWSVVSAHIWATKAHDADIMVRVPRGSYSDYVKPLELDATGILVPHCMGLEDAKNVVKMTRFHPLGLRAIDGGNADGAYTNMDFHEYLRQANQQRFVALQIEDPEPLDELDEIAALDGIDMLFFGPGDFSQAIGAPGEWNHPRLVAARKRVAEVCIRHGKFAATTGSIDRLEEFIALGYKFVSVGADVVGVSQYCTSLVSKFKKDATATPAIQGGYK